MTTLLSFKHQNEVFSILVKGETKEIYYSDRKLKAPTRLVPVDIKIKRQILFSRNKIPNYILDMYDLTPEEQKEYESAKTEEELVEICIRDAKSQGSVLINKSKVDEEKK